MTPIVDYDWSRFGKKFATITKPDIKPDFVKFTEGLIIDPSGVARIVINPRANYKHRVKIHYKRECGGGSWDIEQGPEAEKMIVKLSDPAVWKLLGLNFVDLTKIPCKASAPDQGPARSMEL